MKKLIQTYFTFSKKELNGILILFLLLTLILLVPVCYRLLDEPERFDLRPFRREIASFRASAVERKRNYPAFRETVEEKLTKAVYFDFDPNTVSLSGLAKLGFSSKQVKIIDNYRTKKGRFYKTEDLKKIYSITELQYKGLEPYIKIERASASVYKDRQLPVKANFASSRRVALNVELNTADSTLLDELRGIGPAFASRIIRYRARLGGFYSKEQLKEVYGMDSTRYSQVENQVFVDPLAVRQVKVNLVTFEELKAHPYLNFRQINAIIQYRKQHGNFASLDDLRKVLVLNDEIIRKIGPYLSFDP